MIRGSSSVGKKITSLIKTFLFKKNAFVLFVYIVRLQKSFLIPFVYVRYIIMHVLSTNRKRTLMVLPVPLKPIITLIPTDLIIYSIGTIKNKQQLLWAVPGDWDINDVRKPASVDAHPKKEEAELRMTHETINQMFVKGAHYTESSQYKYMMHGVKSKTLLSNMQGCQKESDVHKYFERLILAYESIKNDGYKLSSKPQIFGSADEISVYLTRKGEFCQGPGGGRHRFFIAKTLNIKNIPVCIKGAHPIFINNLTIKYKRGPFDSIKSWLKDNGYTIY